MQNWYPFVRPTSILVELLTIWINPLTPMSDPRQNFTLQYQYNIRQTSNDNQEKH